MKIKRVLVIGATGLVGSNILRKLTTTPDFEEVLVLTRRPLGNEVKSPKIREYQMDFDQLDTSSDCFKVDAVICAIGTTIKKAGSEANFRKVDYTYPLNVAKIAKNNGASHFALVSSIGADANSIFFYNRTKGQLERELMSLKFDHLVIARPSVLVGPRSESRPGEKVAQVFGQFLPKRWRSIPAEAVASSLIKNISEPRLGFQVLENHELLDS